MSKSRISDKLGKFRRLEREDKRLFLHAAAWLLLARLMILVMPFRRLAHWASWTKSPLESAATPKLIKRVGIAVSAAANNVPWRSDCFPQSIAASRILARHGYASTIHIGVEKDSDITIAGHAWLVCGDTIVTGGDDVDRYVEMHSLSA